MRNTFLRCTLYSSEFQCLRDYCSDRTFSFRFSSMWKAVGRFLSRCSQRPLLPIPFHRRLPFLRAFLAPRLNTLFQAVCSLRIRLHRFPSHFQEWLTFHDLFRGNTMLQSFRDRSEVRCSLNFCTQKIAAFNIFKSFWKVYLCETAAISGHTVADCPQPASFLECNFLQIFTLIKCASLNLGNALRNSRLSTPVRQKHLAPIFSNSLHAVNITRFSYWQSWKVPSPSTRSVDGSVMRFI